ncbi:MULTISPECIES: YheC/YheD family protein [unclassified Paenibacillus]|uniref:YheC/YheD family protein n=1 Tax=unclassified Paenibacillus TaxID=185978 RepID=UPI002F41EB9E
MRHKYILSKMKKERPLKQDSELSKHVPATRWLNSANLISMLKKYSTLYVKPDTGSSGRGIIRIKRLSDSTCLISSKNGTVKCAINDAMKILKKRMLRNKKYIVQQGISLASYRGRPFDFRVVLQYTDKKWSITWMSAKVASRKNAVVTNVAQGAKDKKIEPTISGADQNFQTDKVMSELRAISNRIAKKLGSRFPVGILGLDMGIDKKGKIWFIEANTNPSFHGLRKLDPVQYRRYLRAKRKMRRSGMIK